MSFSIDYEEERNRLSSFFRAFTAIPHIIWLWIYGIGAFFVLIASWFAVLFTAKFPEGLYGFLERYARYYGRVGAYILLASDKFPPFDGRPDHDYAARLQVGPPKEKYSRAKVFFRYFLALPYAFVAYFILIAARSVAVVSWFVILFMGHQPRAIQNVFEACLSYEMRFLVWMHLLTEDWPTIDDPVSGASSPGTTAGRALAASAAPAAAVAPPAAPAPPAPPAPPEPDA